ncbi:MAG TPA: hypothetical protein VFX49_17130, partial [Chloroflexota bacterium]|nr:hypothetical protein [Chloroflexota bacterium]
MAISFIAPRGYRANVHSCAIEHTVGLILDSRQRRARFGRYAAELLRAEGLAHAHLFELASVTAQDLSRCAVVVVTSCGAVDGTVALLASFVAAGGRLILLRPALELAPLLGLDPLWRASIDSRLLVDSRSHPFGDFPYVPLQLLAPLDLYRVVDPSVTVHARAASLPWGVESDPCIVERAVGNGRVLAFLYDLPQTIALLRQGDPALSEVDSDGLVGIRPNDSQQWQIDPALGMVPQADVHQALLARAVEHLAPFPMPRLWHLPGHATSLLVLTGDLCANRPDEWLLDEAAFVEKHGGTMSFYLHVGAEFDPSTIARLREGGHTLSIHPFAQPFSVPHMDVTLGSHLETFAQRFGDPPPHTVRHHRLQWLGWAEQAKLQHKHGLRLDLNFTTARPLRNGYLFGSGRPLRFVDDSGKIVDCWQHPTQFEDDLILGDHEISLRVGTAEANALYDTVLDESLARWHSALAVNAHPGNFARYAREWEQHLIRTTAAKGVPIWNPERWLEFVDARDAVTLPVPTGGDGGWRFDASLPTGADLTLLSPERHGGARLADDRDTPAFEIHGWRYVAL